MLLSESCKLVQRIVEAIVPLPISECSIPEVFNIVLLFLGVEIKLGEKRLWWAHVVHRLRRKKGCSAWSCDDGEEWIWQATHNDDLVQTPSTKLIP